MSTLERRYRLLLKVLPSWYRTDREEEMVGIFLESRAGEGYDDLDGEYGWPGWPETRSTLSLAVRTRFAADDAPAHAVTLGDVTRRIALLGLVAGVMWSGAFVASIVFGLVHGFEAVRVTPWTVVELAPVAALAALAFGWRTLAKAFVALQVCGGLVGLSLSLSQGGALQWATQASFLLPSWLALACLCLGFHREARLPSVKPWLVAGAVAGVVGAVATWFQVGLVLPMALALVVLLVRRWRDPVTTWAVAAGSAVLLPEANFMVVVMQDPRSVYVAAIVLLTAGTLVPLVAAMVRRASVPGFRRP
ncbi:hypothetical protein FKR81_27835 [Lentzea tibetensis]|uniref:Uncharacterized protein n=1 Tax=Lentzea tibetensis TaxID=2591470 RepID=A0A563EMP8_9PSEU|nr:hypothetical protein [Lentzea tibetensis]TWP48412.1 hypothetical protein FKR81_27835 [Lentzea tibetensis]